jgi:transcriptional regulator with XRE-family HTH domain
MLENIRKLYGYTQEELAKMIGTTQQFYTQIETGSARGSRLLSKLSDVLKIKGSCLAPDAGYVEYPFLSDFYVFCLTEARLTPAHEWIAKYICAKSEFIDMVSFLVSPSQLEVKERVRWRWPGYPVGYFALKDDRDTVFLFKRRRRSRPFRAGEEFGRRPRDIESRIFGSLDFFREMLHSLRPSGSFQGPYIYERTIMTGLELFAHIEQARVVRDDILKCFLSTEDLHMLCNMHMSIKKR